MEYRAAESVEKAVSFPICTVKCQFNAGSFESFFGMERDGKLETSIDSNSERNFFRTRAGAKENRIPETIEKSGENGTGAACLDFENTGIDRNPDFRIEVCDRGGTVFGSDPDMEQGKSEKDTAAKRAVHISAAVLQERKSCIRKHLFEPEEESTRSF